IIHQNKEFEKRRSSRKSGKHRKRSDTSSGGSFLDENDREVSSLTDRAFKSLCIGDEAVYNDSHLGLPSSSTHIDRQLAFAQDEPFRDEEEREELKRAAHQNFSLRVQQYGQDWVHEGMYGTSTHKDPEWGVYGDRTQGRVSATFQNSFVETSQQGMSLREEELSFISNGATELSLQHHRSRSRVSSLIRTFNSEVKRNGANINDQFRGCNVETNWDKSALMNIHNEFSDFSSSYQQNLNSSSNFPSAGPFSCRDDNFYSSDMAAVAHMSHNSVSSFMRSSHNELSMSAQANCNSPFFIHSEFSPFKVWREHNRFPFQQREISGFMHCSQFPKWYETPMYKELSLENQLQGPYRGMRHSSSNLAPRAPSNPSHFTSMSLMQQKASAVEKRSDSDISTTPFTISQLPTPSVTAHQEENTSGFQQHEASPQPVEHPPVRAESRGVTPDARLSSYKSRATSLLFNLKDNRKRVKSTYSPTKFKGLDKQEKNQQPLIQEPRETLEKGKQLEEELMTRVDNRKNNVRIEHIMEESRASLAEEERRAAQREEEKRAKEIPEHEKCRFGQEQLRRTATEQQWKYTQENQHGRAAREQILDQQIKRESDTQDKQIIQGKQQQVEQQSKLLQKEHQQRAAEEQQSRSFTREKEKRATEEQKTRFTQEEKQIVTLEQQQRRSAKEKDNRRAMEEHQKELVQTEQQKIPAEEQQRKFFHEKQPRKAAEEQQIRQAEEEKQRKIVEEQQRQTEELLRRSTEKQHWRTAQEEQQKRIVEEEGLDQDGQQKRRSAEEQQRSIALDDDESRSVISNLSEDVESYATSAADVGDVRGLLDFERPESACSFSSDVSRSLGKPPVVPPKTEKALRRAQRLTSRRMKKELSKVSAGGDKETSSVPSSSTETHQSNNDAVASPHFSQPVSLAHAPVLGSTLPPSSSELQPVLSCFSQSYPMTQRKVLQDLGSGQYYVVDVPVQVQTKTFFDPETGKYVQLNVRESGQSISRPHTQHTQLHQTKLQPQPFTQTPTAGKPFVLYQRYHSYPQNYQPTANTPVRRSRSSAPGSLQQNHESLSESKIYGNMANEVEQNSVEPCYSPERTPYMDTVIDTDKTHNSVKSTQNPMESASECGTKNQTENHETSFQYQGRDIITMSELEDFMEATEW
uniref:DUF4585 domain-containing protein n=1 Tax=Oryzias latipes TaxID=8090 RepID=A0A3B3IDX7_ORYLA